MNEEFGKRVSVEDAEKYFTAHEHIAQNIISDTPLLQTAAKPGQPPVDLTSVYKNSAKNAFVFNKDMVITMLTEKDNKGEVPQYLMVHFAAKFEDGDGFSNGEPTLVILGCRKSSTSTDKKITFLSMDVTDPGGEQPGGRTVARFPPTVEKEVDDKTISFTFEM